MPKFLPLNDDELQRQRFGVNLGVVKFKVEAAVSSRSMKGNDQIILDVFIKDSDGNTAVIKDYLIFTPRMLYKIKAFCATTKQITKYEAGNLDVTDCIGKIGLCKVGIQKGTNGYPDRLRVEDYVLAEGDVSQQQSSAAPPPPVPQRQPHPQEDFDDGIPF